MNPAKKPSIWQVLMVDYVSMILWLAPLVMWALYLMIDVFQVIPPTSADQASPRFLLMVALGTTIFTGLFLPIRVFSIFTVFWNGVEVPGRISNIWFFRDRGRVEVVYTYMGENMRSSTAIHLTKRTRALQMGADVTLVVDRGNPKRALIRDLYTK